MHYISELWCKNLYTGFVSPCRVILIAILSLLGAFALGQSEFELTIPQGARSQVMVDVGGSIPTAKYWAVFDDESNMIAYDEEPNDWDIDIVNTAPGTYKIVVESPYPIPLETYELWAWDESGGWASVLAHVVPSQSLSLAETTNESVKVSAASAAYQPSYAKLEIRKGTSAWTTAEQFVPANDEPVPIDLQELDPHSDYSLRLSSFAASGQTDYATASFHTKPNGSEQVGVFAVSNSSIAVYWSRVQGATAYKVYRASNLGQYNWGAPVAVINTNLNQPILKWVDTGLPSYSMRYYRVTAVVDGYQSQPSEEDCHYANPNALPWDQGLSSVIPSLTSQPFDELYPIGTDVDIISPSGEYYDSTDQQQTTNPAGRDDIEKLMFGPTVAGAPFTGDGIQTQRQHAPQIPVHPSDLPLYPESPDLKVKAEGAFTRRDAPSADFVGFTGTFVFPSRNNEVFFKQSGTTSIVREGQNRIVPLNSLNMYVGWAPPIPSGPGPAPTAHQIAADIGIQYYPSSDNTGSVISDGLPEAPNPGGPGTYPSRYIPFIRVSVKGKEVAYDSSQLNFSTVYPTRRYLDAVSNTGWLYATLRVAYVSDSKTILYQLVWGKCNEFGLNQIAAEFQPSTLAAPWSGPFFSPTVNKGAVDILNEVPFEFDNRIRSRRVVSIAQRKRDGNARALNFYRGTSNSPSSTVSWFSLWERMPWAAWTEDSYARNIRLIGWDCLGYFGNWSPQGFSTEEFDEGPYVRTARHDLGASSEPFGARYLQPNPFLDSLISIDHRSEP